MPPDEQLLTTFVMKWALELVLCLDTLTGRAATVVRFMYRLTESVGEGFKEDTPAVQSSLATLGSSLPLMVSHWTIARCLGCQTTREAHSDACHGNTASSLKKCIQAV